VADRSVKRDGRNPSDEPVFVHLLPFDLDHGISPFPNHFELDELVEHSARAFLGPLELMRAMQWPRIVTAHRQIGDQVQQALLVVIEDAGHQLPFPLSKPHANPARSDCTEQHCSTNLQRRDVAIDNPGRAGEQAQSLKWKRAHQNYPFRHCQAIVAACNQRSTVSATPTLARSACSSARQKYSADSSAAVSGEARTNPRT
jgi:hypothetical protein